MDFMKERAKFSAPKSAAWDDDDDDDDEINVDIPESTPAKKTAPSAHASPAPSKKKAAAAETPKKKAAATAAAAASAAGGAATPKKKAATAAAAAPKKKAAAAAAGAADAKKTTAKKAAGKKRKAEEVEDEEGADAEGDSSAPKKKAQNRNNKKALQKVKELQKLSYDKFIPRAPIDRELRDRARKMDEEAGGDGTGSTHMSKQFVDVVREAVTQEMIAVARLACALRAGCRKAKKVIPRDWNLAAEIVINNPNFALLKYEDIEAIVTNVSKSDVEKVEGTA